MSLFDVMQNEVRMELTHLSVLLTEAVTALGLKRRPNGIYIDATLGGGGHSALIASQLHGGRLIGVDQDDFAIKKATDVLAQHIDSGIMCIVKANFAQTEYIMQAAGVSQIDGILMDLGVSSFHFDDGARGFSYNHDAALDMRMDKSLDLTARDVVNGYSESELERIFRDYGEEKWARRIAQFVVDKRTKDPINTTFELVAIIKAAIPRAARSDGPHPAKRVFQAIRIEVNNELGVLETALNDYVDLLAPQGRICVITFHSLEDRLVKNAFRRMAATCTCPREFPICTCNTQPKLEIITNKPILPSSAELETNHRARSAKLRVAQKI